MFDFDTLTDRSGTGACKWDRRADAEKASGIVPLSIADMEYQVPPCVRDAALRAAEHGVYGYTDPTPAYTEAVLGFWQRRHRLIVNQDALLPITGVVPALCVSIRAFTAPGDGVLIESPVYPPFRKSITRNHRRVEAVSLIRGEDNRYTVDFDAFERAAAKPDVKLFLLCSPHNPVGRVWTREELARKVEICEKHGVRVVSDEIHADLVLHGNHIPLFEVSPWARESGVMAVAASKTFNVPGLQLASVLIEDPVLRARFKAQSEADGFDNMAYFGHAVTLAAYNEGEPWLDALLDAIRANESFLRAFLQKRLPMLRVSPIEGTYLAWIDCRALDMPQSALMRFLREEAGLIVNSGEDFGPEGVGFIRMNLAAPRFVLHDALERWAAALARNA